MVSLKSYPNVATGVVTRFSGERARIEVFGNARNVSGVQQGLGLIFYQSGHSAAVERSKVLKANPGISVIEIKLLDQTP